MFVSTYEVNIDSKGRVSVPAAFRQAMGGGGRVYLYPSMQGLPCLEGGGESLMELYQQAILRLDPFDPEREILAHTLGALSHDLKMDEPGRIKLPEPWVEEAGISASVIFAGKVDKFELWEPKAFAAYGETVRERRLQPNVRSALARPYREALADGAIPGVRGPRTGEG